MTRRTTTEIADARLLAAMKAVNPTLEKLMADRLELRQDMREVKAELERAQRRAEDLRQVREVLIPHTIAVAKTITLSSATLALAALTIALFTKIFSLEITATLSASFLLPILLVDVAEKKFGRVRLYLPGSAVFIPLRA